MHPIFEIRDILDEICFWLIKRDLAATIRLNKIWSEASIGPLWKSVKLTSALKLLGPTVSSPQRRGFYDFSGSITLEQWKRFVYYAQYVRILRAHGSDSLALLTAITFRPRSLEDNLSYFFPRCQYLHWCATDFQADAVNLKILVSPTLDHVVLSGDGVDRVWFNQFCQLLLNGLSNLRVFRIDYSPLTERPKRSDPFYFLLMKFAHTLTSIQIPELLLTRTVTEKLLNVNSLSDLVVQECRHFDEPVLTKQFATDTNHNRGNFSSFKSLSLGPYIDELIVLKFFRPFLFPALRSLHWHFPDALGDVDTLFGLLSRTCPNLETLKLGTWGIIDSENVSWSSIRSLLLGCARIVNLSLLCFYSDMTLDNLAELLKIRKAPLGWLVLELSNYRPFHFQDALLLVAKHSPSIHRLGIRVHDKVCFRPFGDIIPSNLEPLPLQNNAAQLELENLLRRAGFFLPFLTAIFIDNSMFLSESEKSVASLLLALSENQVKVGGDDWAFCKRVTDCIAEYYGGIRQTTKNTS